jgi:dTDP-4-amino-4,6-dideoxygalactose transaminase
VTRIPFFDLRRQFEAPLRDEIFAGLQSVCESQSFILGQELRSLEEEVGRKFGCIATGVSSGTDAETLLWMAFGIGPGDAVVTTPFTFFSTAGTIARAGARPIFADIEESTCNLDPRKVREFLECRCILTGRGLMTQDGLRVRAVVPVHLFGLCADLAAFEEICEEFGLLLIEDAAQAIGARYPGPVNRYAGTVGNAGFLSFYPTKNLGAFGDAGMVLCRDEELAQRLRVLRNLGMEPRYYHHVIGGNFRLDELQACVLRRKWPYLEHWSEKRWRNAQQYKSGLAELNELQLPEEPYLESCGFLGHIHHQFVVRSGSRDALRSFLTERGIGTEIYYPLCLHQQPCFRDLLRNSGELPNSEKAARESLALPIFPELNPEEIGLTIETIKEFFTH